MFLSLIVSAVMADPLPLSADQENALRPQGLFKECKTCPDMVVVPAGQFLMGARADERVPFATPQHEVRITSRFAVSRTEVSVDQYTAFVRDTGRATQPGCQALADALNGIVKQREALSWRDPGFPQKGTSPVTCVSWLDAKAYVDWLARVTGKPYRLLSEAEWEYAARGGATTPYSFGGDANDLCRYANGADRTLLGASKRLGLPAAEVNASCSDGHAHTAPAGSFSANRFGLHDMHGNVSEWVEDCSIMLETGRGYDGAPGDGSPWIVGRCTSRVARGGDWGSPSRELQSNFRSGLSADRPADTTGIRVARSLSQ